jgi:diguanylate cyclase (GGDEF)-like protein
MKLRLNAIEHHSERIYVGVQLLLLTSTSAALYLLIVADRGDVAGWLALFCLAATGTCIATLVYLRSSLAFRLKAAWKAEQERFQLVSADPLTSTLSRRHFLESFREMLGSPFAPQPLTLLLVDLDHFKQLNDSLGHQCGDAALRYLASAMSTVFPKSVIGRLGGDEFGVIVRSGDARDSQWKAERLVDLLRSGMTFEGKQIPLGASIGIASTPAHAQDVEGLLSNADLALYGSKRNGRNRATIFDPEMLADRRHHRFLERELRAAIYLDELELHYQPVVDADGTVFAVEALLRWRHAVRGIIPPSDFIPVAEQSALIDSLGAWVFRRACRDAHRLPGHRISINVSAEQIKREDLVVMLSRILKETGLEASRFVLEITETAAMAASAEVVARLQRLRDMGFRIALDDFGTGHCGFNYLTQLPIDSIKVDRSYIRALASDPVASVFTSALCQIARLLDLTIVAEGVETENEFALARAAGCDRFQGYYFGRPGSLEPMEEPVRLACA